MSSKASGVKKTICQNAMHLVFSRSARKAKAIPVRLSPAKGPLLNRTLPLDVYLHVRVLFSMILGLSVARLLAGFARIVRHPKEYKVYWVHLLRVLFLFPCLIRFLVAGIPAPGYPTVDLSALLLRCPIRRPAVSALRLALSRRDG